MTHLSKCQAAHAPVPYFNRADLDRNFTGFDQVLAFISVTMGSLSASLLSFINFTTNTHSIVDNFTNIRGRHTLKTGLETREARSYRIQGGLPTHTYNTTADLIADKPARIGLVFNTSKRNFTTNYGFYGQDDWRNQRSLRGSVLTQCLGIALAAQCLFLVGLTSSSAVLIPGLVVFGLGRGFFDCNMMPVLSQIARADLRSTGYGLLNLAGTLTGGIVAAAAGALKNAIGLGGVFQAAALLMLVSIVLLIRFPHRQAASR